MRNLSLLALLFSFTAAATSYRANTSEQFLNAEVPTNYIVNSGAEKNVSGVTGTTSIVSRVTPGIIGDGSFSLTATAAAQVVCFTAKPFKGILNQTAQVRLRYQGDGTKWKIYGRLAGVVKTTNDAINNVLTSVASPAVALSPTMTMYAGVSATDVPDVCLESLAASTALVVDGVYAGQVITQVSPPSGSMLWGSITYSATTGCVWTTSASTSYANFPAQSSCSTGTVTGNAAVPGTKILGMTFASLPRGEYLVVANGGFYFSASGGTGYYRVTDGTNNSQGVQLFVSGATPEIPGFQQRLVETTDQSNVTIQLQAATSSGTASAQASVTTPAAQGLEILVYKMLTPGDASFTQDSPGAQWTSFTPTGSWTANTTYTGKYMCQNNTLSLQYLLALTGAPTAASLSVNLPTGFNADSTALVSNSSTQNSFISAVKFNRNGVDQFDGVASPGGTSALTIFAKRTASGTNPVYLDFPQASNTIPATFASGDSIVINVTGIPVDSASPCSKGPGLITQNNYVVPSIRTVTASTTLTSSDNIILCDATAGAVTITLPPVATTQRQIYSVKKIDSSANGCTTKGNGSENIDGVNTKANTTQYLSYQFTNNGAAWYIY